MSETKNRFAQIADRCKDENFKRIYQITAEKMNAKSNGFSTDYKHFVEKWVVQCYSVLIKLLKN